ncbi:tethering complex subunit VPS16 ASCRUDRAFT_6963 [Ascoidea rubescens DSM 1968]|uniref:Vacuolar protein sorting-associated protein 16 homolog n=1 Tax=Ascoidea rubescens DSM 1968 TaxID=1344418 RepID=A0A1D2VL92_9ASCO|nr:hypothetical protein ASCRUDRAFT_6963 [Ascoidea rubescens DSM 1968]ODV62373.1 hypothetical protein ASCRUDRAFT_6963 [Ascoidea rubescens DSM 1968]
MASNPSLGWERLKDVFYRVRECYSLSWNNINISNYIVAVAPFSTAIALYPKSQPTVSTQNHNNTINQLNQLNQLNRSSLNAITSTLTNFNQDNTQSNNISGTSYFNSDLHASNTSSGSNVIQIFSGSGSKLFNINWNEVANGKIVDFFFSINEDLIIILENGIFRNYYDFNGNFNEFSLGFNSDKIGINDIKYYSTGFVARLNNNNFIHVNDYNNPYPRLLASFNDKNSNNNNISNPNANTANNKVSAINAANIDNQSLITTTTTAKSLLNDSSSQFFNDTSYFNIHAWNIISPSFSLTKNIEILISRDDTIYTIDDQSINNKFLNEGPFDFIAISPNAEFLSLYSSLSNKVYIISSDFQRKLSEFELNNNNNNITNTINISAMNNDNGNDTDSNNDKPLQLQWCGNDAVVLSFNDEIKLIGPSSSYINFYYDSPVFLNTEIDGIRILSNSKLEFLSRVPDLTVNIFKIGSTSPSSILLDSIDTTSISSNSSSSFNSTSLENLSIIKDGLVDAINCCIKGSTEEFDVYWQKKLLKAASFGKSFLEFYNSDFLIESILLLKILNQIRSHNIGMFLTFNQFNLILSNGLNFQDNLINNLLIKRNQFFLALKISEKLNLPNDLIYINWACLKIKYSPNVDDKSLLKIILNKLSVIKNISFEKISQIAYQEGRLNLSIMLLNYEPVSGKKIPLLLNMEEDELALVKAQESLNYELILYVLLILYYKYLILKNPSNVNYESSNLNSNSGGIGEFFNIINNKKIAMNYLEKLLKEKNFANLNPEDSIILLKKYYYSFDNRINIANFQIIESLKNENIDRDLLHNNLNNAKTYGSVITTVSSNTSNKTTSINGEISINNGTAMDTNNLNNTITNITNANNELINRELEKFEQQKSSINKAIKSYNEFKNSNNRNYIDDLKYLQSELKLIQVQENLTKDLLPIHPNFKIHHLSVIQTIEELIKINKFQSNASSSINNKTFKILKEFKITELRYQWLVLKTLTKQRKFNDLLTFVNNNSSASGKIVIGYKPIVNECLKYGNKKFAALFVKKSNDIPYQEKLDYYLKCGDFRNYCEEAVKNKDLNRLKEILQLYNENGTSSSNTAIIDIIQQYINKIKR